jgi:Polyferredoxin
LKKLRLRPLLVWTFLSGFAALFLLRDAGGSGLLGFGAKIQVFPALLRWEITVLLFAGMTLLAGRFYCSLLCPLGLFQEAVHGLGKHRMAGYRRGTSLRYWILAATVISMAAGTLGLLHLLDPFANFGRGVTQILRPTIVALNNLLASIPLPGDTSRFLHALPPTPLTPLVAAAAGLFLAAIAAWSVLRGRPYCDGLCPVGTFLGLFSSHSALRIRFDESSCSNCGRCEAACPTACLSALERKIDYDRCVLCLSCIEACPGGALRLGILPAREGLQRRSFLRVAAGLATALGLAWIRRYRKPSAISGTAEAAGPPISPPGSGSHENFSRKCIACSACVKACPAGIIRPALMAGELQGFSSPPLTTISATASMNANPAQPSALPGPSNPFPWRPSSVCRSAGPSFTETTASW